MFSQEYTDLKRFFFFVPSGILLTFVFPREIVIPRVAIYVIAHAKRQLETPFPVSDPWLLEIVAITISRNALGNACEWPPFFVVRPRHPCQVVGSRVKCCPNITICSKRFLARGSCTRQLVMRNQFFLICVLRKEALRVVVL